MNETFLFYLCLKNINIASRLQSDNDTHKILNVEKASLTQYQGSLQHIHIHHSQKSQKKTKKFESSPITHVTKPNYLHILEPPAHFASEYIIIFGPYVGVFLEFWGICW